ncbi:hypothetical protein KIN20_015689 [Parelaphostrongylus tenuis]|uniref:Uncharacterized protein n=1 Tax=Parelaphostrongylus tenuis TaxID=148309 RepID=A0AAD5QQ76_PARTN|nr:hypothetical protein KIN20_015689 [Parelaphostrongylus tenuis]
MYREDQRGKSNAPKERRKYTLETTTKREDEIEQQRREDDDDIDKWEDHWTLQGQVNTALIHHSEPDDNEEIDWEKYWTLESAGTEEFTAPEKEEKMRRDQKYGTTSTKLSKKERPATMYVSHGRKSQPHYQTIKR